MRRVTRHECTTWVVDVLGEGCVTFTVPSGTPYQAKSRDGLGFRKGFVEVRFEAEIFRSFFPRPMLIDEGKVLPKAVMPVSCIDGPLARPLVPLAGVRGKS